MDLGLKGLRVLITAGAANRLKVAEASSARRVSHVCDVDKEISPPSRRAPEDHLEHSATSPIASRSLRFSRTSSQARRTRRHITCGHRRTHGPVTSESRGMDRCLEVASRDV